VPDPYNPKPHTLIDTIREKWLFRLSTAIETGAATTLAYGNFKVNPKTGKNDVVGGMGGVALMGGLTTRLFAEFGTRVLNRQELYDDLVDCFARVLPENLQQAVADTAAKLHKHYDKKSPGVAQIYERLATQLYHDYAIAVLPEEASTRTAAAPVIEANAVKRFADRSREHFNHTQRTIANANRALLQPAL